MTISLSLSPGGCCVISEVRFPRNGPTNNTLPLTSSTPAAHTTLKLSSTTDELLRTTPQSVQPSGFCLGTIPSMTQPAHCQVAISHWLMSLSCSCFPAIPFDFLTCLVKVAAIQRLPQDTAWMNNPPPPSTCSNKGNSRVNMKKLPVFG